jgi:hypothetical protein
MEATFVARNTRGNKEYTREQRLIKENRQLKQQVAQLRKQLARLDLDRYDHIREAIEEHCEEREEKRWEGKEILESLKHQWKCKIDNCPGFLEIFLFNKVNSTYYYRQCNCCSNRTKSKKYDPSTVKGIMKEGTSD